MSYVHDHEILSREKMVIGYVSADKQLGAGGLRLADEGTSGPSAHGHPAHRNVYRPGCPDGLKGEFFLYIPYGIDCPQSPDPHLRLPCQGS